MKFTVEDALKLDSLEGAKVVAGHKGLQNSIRFVNTMEVPDISDWISGYEMILTTGYPYKDSEKDWKNLIKSLKTKNLSAFSMKTDRYILEIPKEVIDMGNELNIPIIELSSDAKFDLIIKDVMREIVNKDYTMIKKSETIHRNFTEIILSGGGLKEIVDILSKLTNSFVIIQDKDNNILAESSNFKFIKNKEIEKGKEEKRSIIIHEKTSAHIRLISLDKEFEEEDIISLERARDAVAMVMIKKQGIEEIEKKYKNDFLNDVIKGAFNSKESLVERGKFFNIDFNNSYLLLLLNIDSLDYIFSKEYKKRRLQTHNILLDIFNVVYNSFFSKSQESIIWSMNKSIFILYPILKQNVNNNKVVKNLSIDISKSIKDKIDEHINEFTISIGIGKFYENVLDIHKSYDEAIEALRIGKLVWGDNNIYHYDDIEVYNILLRSGSNEELENFIEQKLGKLIEYDKKRNTRLLDTLEKILYNDGNLKTTADTMFLHPKTVSYRRDQIEKILDISLNDMEEKFSIYMALKIKQLLQSNHKKIHKLD